MDGALAPGPLHGRGGHMSNRAALARRLYVSEVRIRCFEETVAKLFAQNRLPGFVHLSIGQEAVAAGACAALREDDVIATNHRGHGHCIAKGADPKRMMAELFGRRQGYSGGVGGSMHIADLDRGILGANGIVGASILIATGAGFSFQARQQDRVALAFFGDGAINEGAFHEGLNIAALWRLPVVYLCENNGYAELTPSAAHIAGRGVLARGEAYGVRTAAVDGTDALAVFDAVRDAVERARSGAGPCLLEARTNRWHGHYEGDPQGYRRPEELEAIRRRDPITILGNRLRAEGWADDTWMERIRRDAEEEMALAADYGASGTPLTINEMLSMVYVGGGRSS